MSGKHIYGSNIPLARAQLYEIARELDDVARLKEEPDETHELSKLASRVRDTVDSLMHRTAPDKVTRSKLAPPNAKKRAEIRRLRQTTSLSQQEIADKVGVNSGRVSEAVHEFD